MLVVLLIELITIRFAINALGDIDYGIYSVVGGVTGFLSFITATLTPTSIRYFSYDIATGNTNKLNNTFNTFLLIYAVFALIILLIAESLGVWMINYVLNIPNERLSAANWVFQISIFSFVITLLSTPYISMFLSKENMKVYAYIGILQVIIILISVLLLSRVNGDHLILYSLFIAIASFVSSGLYFIISFFKYPETHINKIFDMSKVKDILRFVSWSLLGSLSGVCLNQGNNMVINYFYGPKANTAFSISHRIGNALTILSSNMLKAINPQMIKCYSRGEYDNLNKLFNYSNILSVYLNLLLIIPIYSCTEYIVRMWLGSVPEYVISFSRLAMILSVIMSLQTPITIIVQAAKKVKKYHGLVDTFTLSCLPISIVLQYLGLHAESVLIVTIIIISLAQIIRLFILKEIISFSIYKYFTSFVLKFAIIIALTITPIIIWIPYLPDGILGLIIVFLYTVVFLSALVLLICANRNDRRQLLSYIKSFIRI